MQEPIPNTFAALAAGFLAASIVACSTVQTTQSGVVGVERKQRMSVLVSEEQLEAGAFQAYHQLLGEAQKKGALNRDPQQVERVRRIAQRLIPQTAAFRPDAAKWKWEVNVLSVDEVNAWAMPGGKIAVYSGLIQRLNVTDDELAAVLGHEIAHALREHSRERASSAVNQGLALSALGIFTGMGETTVDLAQMAMEVTFNLPNSREHETEADRIGVELAARAGFDPRAAINLWEKMGSAGRGEPPRWLSTHPPRGDRIQDLKTYSERVMPLYRSAKQ